MKIKQNAQSGFTLIELVMVIVILGILAATALPKFVDLKADAETSATQGIAGALSSAAAINYAACAAKNQTATTGVCVQVAKCSDVKALVNPAVTIETAAAAGKYSLAADTPVTTNGTSQTCSLQFGVDGTMRTASYTAIGAANAPPVTP